MSTYSDSALEMTENFEGLRLTAYQDVKGVWTIGYGHTGPEVRDGMTISQAQAETYLRSDLLTAVIAVERDVKQPLSQGQFDALVDFAFNVGATALEHSTLLRLLNAGNYADVALEFDKWDHAGATVVAGLLRRRQAERAEFAAGM